MLGGSAQQVIAIKTAKQLGYYTVLCDYLPDNPGQYEADKFYAVSTTDADAVYRIAREEKVDGILAYASDPAALPAAMVAEKLGLPTNPSESVAVLGVKHKFRQFLAEHGFACPKVYTFHPDDDMEEIKVAVKDFSFPVVVKPTDSSGSKGVSILKDTQDLDKAIGEANSYSRNKTLIIEEFIESSFPTVIGGDIFVCNGKIILYGEMSCLRDDDGKGLIPIGKKKPSGLNNKQVKRVHHELQRLISMLDIRFGEMNIELLLDRNDNVHFLEVGPRAGGNMIPLQLSDAFGTDLVKANVLVAMGENPQIEGIPREGCFVTYVLHSHKDGIFAGVDFSSEIAPYIYRKVIYKQKGEPVEIFNGAGKAIGIIFLHFHNEKQVEDFCERKDEFVKVILGK